MALEPHEFELLSSLNKGMGRLEQGQASLDGHIAAVSANQKATQAALDAHKTDVSAHGLGTEEKAAMRWREWGLFLIAIFTVCADLYFHNRTKEASSHAETRTLDARGGPFYPLANER